MREKWKPDEKEKLLNAYGVLALSNPPRNAIFIDIYWWHLNTEKESKTKQQQQKKSRPWECEKI